MDNKNFTVKMIIEVVIAMAGFWIADLISSNYFEGSLWATIIGMIVLFALFSVIEWLIEKAIKKWRAKAAERAEEQKKQQEIIRARRERLAMAELEEMQAQDPAPMEGNTMSAEQLRAAQIAIEKVYGGASSDEEAEEGDDVTDEQSNEADDQPRQEVVKEPQTEGALPQEDFMPVEGPVSLQTTDEAGEADNVMPDVDAQTPDDSVTPDDETYTPEQIQAMIDDAIIEGYTQEQIEALKKMLTKSE
jgi:uncharacterized membrane protein